MGIRGEARSGTHLPGPHVVHTARLRIQHEGEVGGNGQTDNMGKLQWWVVQFHCYIHVPDLKHISRYLPDLRYLPTCKYLHPHPAQVPPYLRYVPGKYVPTERWVALRHRDSCSCHFSAGCPCEFRTRTGPARWRWLLSRRFIICSPFSSLSHPSRYGDTFALRARTFGRTFRLLPLLPLLPSPKGSSR